MFELQNYLHRKIGTFNFFVGMKRRQFFDYLVQWLFYIPNFIQKIYNFFHLDPLNSMLQKNETIKAECADKAFCKSNIKA